MLIRYPGSKERIASAILGALPIGRGDTALWDSAADVEYMEPFFGAGAIGFRVMQNLPKNCGVVINDIDPGIAALWRVVMNRPLELIDEISAHRPSVDKYEAWKKALTNPSAGIDELRLACCKLALHQQSFSGLGLMAGSCIGGKRQTNPKYNIESRWNPARLSKAVAACSKAMRSFGSRIRISNEDFAAVIGRATSRTTVYCDPPYYEKGDELYYFSMTDDDHVRLRDSLVSSPASWCVSYDDHPRIRELYAGFECVEIDLKYTIHVRRAATRKNHEVMFLKSAA